MTCSGVLSLTSGSVRTLLPPQNALDIRRAKPLSKSRSYSSVGIGNTYVIGMCNDFATPATNRSAPSATDVKHSDAQIGVFALQRFEKTPDALLQHRGFRRDEIAMPDRANDQRNTKIVGGVRLRHRASANPCRGKCTTISPAVGSRRRTAYSLAEQITSSPLTGNAMP